MVGRLTLAAGATADEHRFEDVDTNSEDHAADVLRYGCMIRSYVCGIHRLPRRKSTSSSWSGDGASAIVAGPGINRRRSAHDPAGRWSMTERPNFLYPGPRREMTITRGGKTYAGQWIVDDEIVTVWLGSIGPHSAHLGGMGAEVLARLLLDELIDGAEAKTR